MYATYNITDDKIRLSLDGKPDENQIKAMREAGFSWWPKQRLNVSKWSTTAEDYVLSLGIEIDFEDSPDDASARLDRFSDYADNAQRNSDAAYDRARKMMSAIPLGQPILIGHHSEKRDRAFRGRIDSGMRKFSEERERASYWRGRAQAAAAHAEYRERPDVIARRIKKMEANKRSFERQIAAHPENSWCHRNLDHLEMLLEYQRALLVDRGGSLECKWNIEVGGRVLVKETWYSVLRVNRKDGKIISVSIDSKFVKVRPIEEIKEYQVPTQEQSYAAKNASKMPPLLNYSGEGFVTMTKEKWDKISKDYKGTRVLQQEEFERHRVRYVMGGGSLNQVFITDIKIIAPTRKP